MTKPSVWGVSLAGIALLLGLAGPAAAQVSNTPAQSGGAWTFSIAPYAWMPTVRSTLNFGTPRGGTVSTTTSASPADYLSKLNFIAMIGAEARHDRFTIMTDLVYANASLNTGNTRLVSVQPGRLPNGPQQPLLPVPPQLQTSTGNRLAATVWSVAGGYTVLQGDWGNIDVVAGMRMLVLGSTTDYQLSTAIVAPNGALALSRSGSLSLHAVNVDAVGGIKGRVNIPGSRFYVPFYADVGTGGVPLTWQVYAAVAWRAADWVDISAGYRYLGFYKSGSQPLHDLSMGGALLAANFRF
ncbi:MAG: hypothetical protein AB7O80_14705 [Acetobacteraceae bacterium]